MKNILVGEDVDMYESDSRRIVIDFELSDVLFSNDNPINADKWWSQLYEKYPLFNLALFSRIDCFSWSVSTKQF